MGVEARVGSARVTAQVDIGYGDAIVVEPEEVELPSLLGFSAPCLAAYTAETAVAEKVEAIVRFGIVTSRFKDYFDLTVLASERQFDGSILFEQIRETFAHRGTDLPDGVPAGLGEAFADDLDAQRQWSAFLERSRAHDGAPGRFRDAVVRVRAMVLPPLQAAARDESPPVRWTPSAGSS